MRIPDYEGGGLVNLVAEIEHRHRGVSEAPRLHPDLAGSIPAAASHILVLFDGLGDLQLRSFPEGGRLAADRVGALDASFSTQTSVATATLATGRPPAQHGLVSYLLRLEDHPFPVNTLWWFDVAGNRAQVHLERFLPEPNLAERLSSVGVETTVVQPAGYLGSPLDRVLYRAASTIGVETPETLAEAAISAVSKPNRVVVCYLPYVDAAGHLQGPGSTEYLEALSLVTSIWENIGAALPAGAALVGTADHGMVGVAEPRRLSVSPPEGVQLYGDDRVIYVRGRQDSIRSWVAELPASWISIEDTEGLWGPGPQHPNLRGRLPDGLVVAEDGYALHYPGNEMGMAGYHGGLTEDELRIPLLVWGGQAG